jgi:type III restriction enzyme
MTQHAEMRSWIQKTPGVCGGEACVRNTRHSVAGIIQWREIGLTDEQILRHHPDLTQDDLDAAAAYYRTHREEIQRAIKEDKEA